MKSSFRDPSGWVFESAGRIYRVIYKDGFEDFNSAVSSPTLKNLVADGKLVEVSRPKAEEVEEIVKDLEAPTDNDTEIILAESRRIPFKNYPYEWCPEALYSAALLTLEIAEKCLVEGRGIKDATPFNIIFENTNPVFVDWLSFEKRNDLDSIWLAQAQFIRTFILPLLAYKHFGIRLDQIFLSSRDGLKPEDLYKMAGSFKRIFPPFLELVALPRLMASRSGKTTSYQKKEVNAEKASFVLGYQFEYLKRTLRKAAPGNKKKSEWAEYVGNNQHFTDGYLAHKTAFVNQLLSELKPRKVLDVGCNTGHFSFLAAKADAEVVAIDNDSEVVGKTLETAKIEGLKVLPLVVDITRPSPFVGWENGECDSFLDRSKDYFDMVMMFAVAHHMMVTERIPLKRILSLISKITTSHLIIEYIPPDDPMFRKIARGRDHLFSYLTKNFFEETCSQYFRIIKSEQMKDSSRVVYLLKK